MTKSAANAQEHAYTQLRELILSGHLEPGSRVHERQISERIGLSRTPVREAVRRLSSEGLIRTEPHRGAFIEKVEFSEVVEIFDVGAVLEARCARLATRKMQPAQIEEMERLYQQMEEVAGQGGDERHGRYAVLDKAFHGVLINATENRLLQAIIQQVISLPVLLKAFEHYQPDDFSRSMLHHGEILQAVKSGDAEWAELAMRTHILSSRNAVMARRKADRNQTPQ